MYNNNKDWQTNKIYFVQGKRFVKFENNTPYILNSLLANSMHTQYAIFIMMAVQNLMIHCHFVLFGDLLQPTNNDLTLFEFFTIVKTFTAASCQFVSRHLLLAHETQASPFWIVSGFLGVLQQLPFFKGLLSFNTTLIYFYFL